MASPPYLIGETLYWNLNRQAKDKDFDFYTVSLSGKNLSFNATYDKEGNLISKNELLKNTPLPTNIQEVIEREFPGYTVEGDKMLLTAYRDNSEVQHYK